jgi:Ca2+/Na+ antiporter
MEAIERAAHVSVGRACAFSGLAILCFMVGFAYDPHLSARVGGSFALLTALVLVVKAWLAPRIPYKRTETWLILEEQDRPPADVAQSMIASVLKRTFLVYALYAAVLALVLLALSVLLSFA